MDCSGMSLFKVGDKVGSMCGDGVVVEVIEDSANPVVVNFESVPYRMSFSEDGRYYHMYDKYPSIWHKETGSAPVVGERPFEYPIYKRAKETGLVVKFTGLKKGEVVVDTPYEEYSCVGDKYTSLIPHTDEWWEDCDAPKFEPSEPTWCWVQTPHRKEKRLVVIFESGVYKYVCNTVGGIGHSDTATPCEDKDIPTWWKELKNGKA